VELKPGTRLLHYEIVEKLGEGGMGRVFKARDSRLNRYVAIKLLPEGAASGDPSRRARFQREAQAAAALDHPSIAVIHEVGEHEGAPYIVMQHVEGVTLGERMREHGLELREWIDVATEIADGLAHAHGKGVVHRDLKPDNVMLAPGGQTKLLDFGLARLLEPEQPTGGRDADLSTRMQTVSHELTQAGKVMGTVAYMSPEQARGEPADHRSDLFSLGVILYQLASGRLPFERESAVESLHATIKEEPPPLSEITADIPAEVERLVRKALEKEPARRYQDAADLAADLRNLSRDLDSGRATIVSGSTPAAVPGTSPTPIVNPQTTISAEVPRGSRRGVRLVVPALLLLAALVAIVLVFGPWRGGGSPSGPHAVGSSGGERIIAVLGFENLADPADTDNVGRMLMGLIATDLAESGGLSVVSTPRVLSARKTVAGDGPFRVVDAEAAARAAGATVMIVGQVTRPDDGLLLTAEWVDVASGQSLGSHRESIGSMGELFALAEAVAEAARQSIGTEAPRATAFDLDAALTDSPEAYEYYVLGESALHEFDFERAARMYEKAIETDSTFALAYIHASTALSWFQNRARAIELAEAGLAHLDRLPKRWQTVYRGILSYHRGEYEAAYDVLSEIAAAGTDIPDVYYVLGEIHTHSQRHSDIRLARENFERALAIDPTFKVVLFHLVDNYIAGDDLARGHGLVDAYLAENPEDAAAREAKMALVAAGGRIDEAIEIGERIVADGHETARLRLASLYCVRGDFDLALKVAEGSPNRDEGSFRTYRAWASIGLGRLEEGLAHYEAGIEAMRGGSLATIAAGMATQRGMMLLFLGRNEQALDSLREALVVAPRDHASRYVLGSEQARLGDLEGARESLARMIELARSDVGRGGQYWELLLRAELEIATNDTDEATRLLVEASSLPVELRRREVEAQVRSRIAEQRGDFAAAARALSEAADIRAYGDWSNSSIPSLVIFRLARLHDLAGDRDAARAGYESFLGRWERAGDVFPAVVEARERLAELSVG
jgi:serine/threonine protein kinase/tetratricopeptide (TPR) repeat protein